MYWLLRWMLPILASMAVSVAAGQEPADQDRLPEFGESSSDDESHVFAEPPSDVELETAGSQVLDFKFDDRPPFRANGMWAPAESLRAQDGTLSMNSERLGIGVPLAIHDDGIWLALGSVQQTGFQTAAILPDSGMDFPDELWNVSLGSMRIKTLANGTQIGGMLQGGSASDQPFANLRDLTFTTLVFATVPYGPRDAWNFSLFYSPTSQTRFPLPGLAYVWRPHDRLQADIGIPASLDYRPTDSFQLMARYTPLTNLQVEARQQVVGPWSLFGRYDIVNETYWLDERLNRRDRFFVFDQRVSAGVSRQLARGFRFEGAAGYLFDRQFFQAESFSDERHDVVEVESGLALWLQLLWTR